MPSPKLNSNASRASIYLVNNLPPKKARTRFVMFAAFLALMFLCGTTAFVQAQVAEPGFNANIVGTSVLTTVVQPDGKILIGGEFTSVGGQPRNNIARLNTNGTVDPNFNPNASGGELNGAVFTIAVQADGKVLAGGYFTTIGGQPRNRIARLDATTGAADLTFDPNAPDTATVVTSIRIQPNGQILVGGVFTNIGGQQRNRIARLNLADGLADTFNPNANSDVITIALQPNGQVLLGGSFTSVGGQTRNNIARVNTDGSLDTFNPNATDSVSAIAVQADGKVLLGGNFTGVGGQTRNFIARVNADGTLDMAYDPNPDSTLVTIDAVQTIVMQPDGKALVGGFFRNIGGRDRNFIARLTTNGTADDFNPNGNNVVNAIALQPADNKVLVGGNFTTIGGQTRNLFARLSNDLPPTAATATIAGRVTVRGRGLARAYVTIRDATGMIQRTMTNPQGFYRFQDIPTGGSYVVEVSSKRYTFASQVVTINESISGLNFTSR